jgi:hypothetical protein
MARPIQTVCRGAIAVAVALLVTSQFPLAVPRSTHLADAQVIEAGAIPSPRGRVPERDTVRGDDISAPPEPIPPPAGHYVGMTKCAACHFKYYENWKASPHGKAFEILPTKYRNDSECLKCHVTGHDAPTATGSAASQTGVTCEACHGPGSEHANLALSYVGQESLLNEDCLKTLRATIRKTSLDQCIQCHTTMAHKPHPEFDRDDRSRSRP